MSVVFVLLGVLSLRAQAQGEIVAGGIVIGYTALSIGAIRSLHHGCCAEVNIGSEVRITGGHAGITDVHGQFVRADVDSITLSADGVARRVARADVATMRVKVRESQWAAGWGVGLLVGGGAGVLAPFAFLDRHNSGDETLPAPAAAVILGIAGGFVGSSVGALVGWGVDANRWRPADLHSAAFKVTLQPTVGKSVGVGVNVGF